MRDDTSGRIIDLMMSLDKVPNNPHKDQVMKSLASSLSTPPRKPSRKPWYKRLFRKS